MKTPHLQETWHVTKAALRGRAGLVATQNRNAAAIGAEILADGGNAVDAAIATSFALAVLEPWMSGPAGGGQMLVAQADGSPVQGIAFGMVAPQALDPSAYPLAPGGGSDLFAWPSVLEDRNVVGPFAMAVPGQIAGIARAHERFASRPWAELLAPAIALAKDGLPVSWHTTLRIAIAARDLARFPSSRDVYLPDGLPPVPNLDGSLPRLAMGRLADTLSRLAEAGPEDFYRGDIAAAIEADMRAVGATVTRTDLEVYEAKDVTPLRLARGDAQLHVMPGLTAGPTFAEALQRLGDRRLAGAPGAEDYLAWAKALVAAYAHRLQSMGHDGDNGTRAPGSTTHITVVDRDGAMVSLTQTLLSVFGARVVLPGTGLLWNNGIMWFDPRPGGPNSLRPGKPPLSNMCPLLACDDRGPWFALGASGGRKIMPAVMQIALMLAEGGLDLETAFHVPRIDASGEPHVGVDPRLGRDVLEKLGGRFELRERRQVVYPNFYACPNAVMREADGGAVAMSDVLNPISGPAAA